MSANPFQGETVAPVSFLSNYAGWSAHSFISPSSHPERSDVLDSIMPQWIILKEQIHNGGNGMWNPLSGGGCPGLLDLTRGLLSPSFLAFFLTGPHWLGYYFAGLIKLLLASVGTYLFLRHFLGVRAAFFGGLVFAFCGFNAAWFHWQHVSTSSLIPWLLWASVGWFFYRSFRWIFATSLVSSALILGGFPAVAVYGFYAAALLVIMMMFVYTSSFREAIFVVAGWGASVATGFFIVAIPLLSLNELLTFIDVSYRQGGTPYQFPEDLILLLDPFFYGLPRVEKTISAGLVACGFALISCIRLRHSPANDRSSILVWYGVLLFVVSLVIAFGLLPHSLLLSIPAIGTSPWNRLSVIAGLALALLSASGLDLLIRFSCQRSRLWQRRIIHLILILCVGAQFFGQVKLFRTFNSKALAADFFPKTTVLEYVGDSLKPTQGVIADNSYLYSGTLGSYGIGEWFAHAFKTNAEKKILTRLVDNPFRSPTSASFGASAIRFDADLYARLGIRYVVMREQDLEVIRKQLHLKNRPAPPLPHNRLSQVIALDKKISVDAIGLMLATYHAPHAPSDVLLTLENEAGEQLGSSRLDAESITDNMNAIFKFKKSIKLVPGEYQLNIQLSSYPEEGCLTVWYSTVVSHDGDYLLFNDKMCSGSFLYKLYSKGNQRYISKHWQRLSGFDNEKIRVYENLLAPDGAYFLSELKESAALIDKDVVTKRDRSDVVRIRYNGDDNGYIIVPMRFYPGWEAYVNGEKVPLLRYLGMLPAVQVAGPANIDLVYEPVWLLWGSILTVLGFVGLIILYILGRAQQIRLNGKRSFHETHHSNSLS